MLAQLEELQKRLWVKRRFVTETNWLISAGTLPDWAATEVAQNALQLSRWRDLSADQAGWAPPPDSTASITDWLHANPWLPVDTSLFGKSFAERVVGEIQDLTSVLKGILINADNYDALGLLGPLFNSGIGCIYIDPPYNTGDDGFPYKDSFRHSSWMTMMSDRMRLAADLLRDDGLMFVQIGDDEEANLRLLLEHLGLARKNTAVVRRGVKNVQAQFDTIDRLSLGHDVVYCVARAADTRIPHLRQAFADEKPGKWDTFWRGTDRPTMRYELLGKCPEAGIARGMPTSATLSASPIPRPWMNGT
jgi:adenine-specific DNA-methyltransferase